MKTNIVDAIREGKNALPRAEEISEELLSVKDNKVIGFCAFGAAAVGTFGEAKAISYFRNGTILEKLVGVYPQLLRKIQNPETHLYKYVFYLNDKKGLTINQVADKLDKRGLR